MTTRRQYLAIYSEYNGNEQTGFHASWYWDGTYFDHRPDAIARGFKNRGSDDFNVGVLDCHTGRLVAIDWMHERVDDDPVVLAEVNEALGLPQGTR